MALVRNSKDPSTKGPRGLAGQSVLLAGLFLVAGCAGLGHPPIEASARRSQGTVAASPEPTGGGKLASQVYEVIAELQVLQGWVDEYGRRLSALTARLDRLESRLSPEAASAPGERANLPLPPGPQEPSTNVPPRPLPSGEVVYREAWNHYVQGDYDRALRRFRTYLTFFPRTSLVPFAQYWLGEAHYSKREYVQAIREFDRLIGQHPGSSKVPSAMLKKGYALLELQETQQARTVLGKLIRKFPDSSEARLAQSALRRLP